MKVAVIAHGLSDGGAERVASKVANYFSEIGHEVIFIAVYSPEREYFLSDKVEYHYLEIGSKKKIAKYISRSLQIVTLLKQNKCDIAVSFLINETVIANLLEVVPIVYSLRIDPADVMRTKKNRLFCKLCYGNSPSVIFQTKDARSAFSTKIQERGVVIGNPIKSDLPFWNSKEHDKVVITACRLTEQKNLPMLIEGFATFYNSNPDYRLKIFGKGEEREKLVELVHKLKIEDVVEFPGYSKNIYEEMAKASIFALTSDFEGLSNSMLEALAIGLPTICTDCPPGGASEYIQDGENGMLVAVGDTEAFSEKLCIMANDADLCMKMSSNSQKIRQLLEENRILEEWNKVICNVEKKSKKKHRIV